MTTTYPTPPGHAALLARRPDLAFPGSQPWPVDLPLLRRVNRDVNASMTYRREPVDVWGQGSDCEDYALAKLEALLAAGVPRGAMRLAVCRPGGGEGHALLIVGDLWCMDSGRQDVFRLDRSKLRLEAWEAADGWERVGATATLADLLRK